MFFRQLLAIVPLLAGVLVNAYSNPGACTGACWAHDPSVIQRASDGLYFKFNTGSGIGISTSTALAGPWTIQGYALPSGSSISNSGSKDLWAPDVTNIDGVYYMYYAVSSFGTQVSAIGLATSSTMMPGSWTDQGGVGISSTTGKNYNAIDPNLIKAGSTYLMNFGSFWGDIYQVPMGRPSVKGDTGAAYNLALNTTGTHAEEGPFMFYYSTTGYYYLLMSAGVCCGYDTTKPAQGLEYRITMCRSKSATGGFVDSSGKSCSTGNGGTTLLASHGTVYGPGGQGVFTDSKLGLVLYYHYADTSSSAGIGDGAYKFGWNQLKWSNGWPVV